MRSFDFAPYYRSTVGFDRLVSMLDQVGGCTVGLTPFRILLQVWLPLQRLG
jgi:hypothetical protein